MIEVTRHVLDNGLRVVVNHDPAVSMAAVNILYNTGARDESRALTGVAHLFEHLMFGGSVNVPDFDLELSDAGGTSNAWTSNDFTNFYDVLPAVNIETALHIESDRMLALAFDPHSLEVQRGVVIEEFKQQCLNTPYGDLMHHLRAAVYSPEHPYSWPVIGLTPDHIAAVTDEDVRRIFYSHYAPNNAVLAISGNIDPERAITLVEKWFGDIPRREIAPRRLPEPGFPTSRVDLTARGNAPVPSLAIAIPMDPYGTRNYFVADCITDILSAGTCSRIYRDMVAGGDGTVIDADASIIGCEHPGMLMLSARLRDAADADRVAERLLAHIQALAGDNPVTQHELERTLNRFESTFALDNLDISARAFNIALAEMHGEDINDTVPRQRSITADDIASTASILADTPAVVLRYVR